jgi:hypothetical protein
LQSRNAPAASAVANVDLNTLGYLMVGLFITVSGIVILVWRLGHPRDPLAARTGRERPRNPAANIRRPPGR